MSRRSSRAAGAAQPAASAPRPHWLQRWPWTPTLLSLAIIVAGLVAVPPIRQPLTYGIPVNAELVRPSAYLVFAPFSALLDTLTLLTIPQHVAIVVTLLLALVGRHAWRHRMKGERSTLGRELAFPGGAFLVLALVYAAAALLPRPMARLEVSSAASADLMVLDFHLHTSKSHDGRPGFTPERARAWARDAGFDAAYITDHRTFEGAEQASANNPALAGQGTVLLPGIEVVWNGEHVNILGAGRTYRGLTTESLRDVDPKALTLTSMIRGKEPVLLHTFPGRIGGVPAANGTGTAGVRAIEAVDGSPRGLAQGRAETKAIAVAAARMNLATVTGTDNHGWGYAPAGWTLLVVPGWRAMTPDSLDNAIQSMIRENGHLAALPVARVVAGASSAWRVALAAPLVAWRMLTTLSPDERAAWLIWTWLPWAVLFLLRRRDARRAA